MHSSGSSSRGSVCLSVGGWSKSRRGFWERKQRLLRLLVDARELHLTAFRHLHSFAHALIPDISLRAGSTMDS
jgi:hypothetical protein